MSRIAVIGCGHVGVVQAACMAELGHDVRGVDIEAGRVTDLQAGRVPFVEPGLRQLLRSGRANRRLRFSTSYAEALTGADAVFLCVNTPTTVTGAADLRYVRDAAGRLGDTLALSGSRPLVIIKSTSPIGTGDTIAALLERTLAGVAGRPGIAANPEFLREGSAVHDFFHPDRIVIGANVRANAERVAALYRGIDAPVILTDLRTAEMVKYVSNAFLAARVSLVNEVARLCERLNVDMDTVTRGVGMDPRIGGAFLRPGIGYGGSCLPKDVAALCHTGESAGVVMRVLSAVQEANITQRRHAVNCIRAMLGPLDGRTIAVWGLTFKGGSEDLRDSPALDVVHLLRNEGATVRAYDPAVPAGSLLAMVDEVCGDAVEAASGADALALLTDWPEFREVDLTEVRAVMHGRLLYDGRNLLDRATVEAADLFYHGVGRAPSWDAVPSAFVGARS